MSHDNKVYLHHILDAIKNIETFTRGMGEEKFLKNKMAQDAVIRNLEIIGEASKKLDTNFKNRHSAVEWKKVAGLRDVLIHNYLGVDIGIVWRVIKNRLPELRKQIKKIVNS